MNGEGKKGLTKKLVARRKLTDVAAEEVRGRRSHRSVRRKQQESGHLEALRGEIRELRERPEARGAHRPNTRRGRSDLREDADDRLQHKPIRSRKPYTQGRRSEEACPCRRRARCGGRRVPRRRDPRTRTTRSGSRRQSGPAPRAEEAAQERHLKAERPRQGTANGAAGQPNDSAGASSKTPCEEEAQGRILSTRIRRRREKGHRKEPRRDAQIDGVNARGSRGSGGPRDGPSGLPAGTRPAVQPIRRPAVIVSARPAYARVKASRRVRSAPSRAPARPREKEDDGGVTATGEDEAVPAQLAKWKTIPACREVEEGRRPHEPLPFNRHARPTGRSRTEAPRKTARRKPSVTGERARGSPAGTSSPPFSTRGTAGERGAERRSPPAGRTPSGATGRAPRERNVGGRPGALAPDAGFMGIRQLARRHVEASLTKERQEVHGAALGQDDELLSHGESRRGPRAS